MWRIWFSIWGTYVSDRLKPCSTIENSHNVNTTIINYANSPCVKRREVYHFVCEDAVATGTIRMTPYTLDFQKAYPWIPKHWKMKVSNPQIYGLSVITPKNPRIWVFLMEWSIREYLHVSRVPFATSLFSELSHVRGTTVDRQRCTLWCATCLGREGLAAWPWKTAYRLCFEIILRSNAGLLKLSSVLKPLNRYRDPIGKIVWNNHNVSGAMRLWLFNFTGCFCA